MKKGNLVKLLCTFEEKEKIQNVIHAVQFINLKGCIYSHIN